ncbi:Ribosomal protein L22 bacterial/chloroplast-type [Penicillium verhagenii]|nr:Ribosomal protein L22 bacterial/chloroplast-type [Penicillium verhagenii]
MGAVLPYGQLVRSAARTRVAYVPRRTLTTTPIRYNQNDQPAPQKSSFFSSMKNWVLGDSKPRARTPAAPKREEGKLGSGSIFAEDLEAEGSKSLDARDKTLLQMGLNPNPKAQLRWEKKMLIREIRKRGRLPKAVQIKRTEREQLSKSHWFKTSVKKLGPLARQIAGKNIDEAILQMRFSKKKAALDVLGHLEQAKNEAMVRAGMGLAEEKTEPTKPLTVILKSGERKTVTDPTNIYIEQAWVNRGPYGFGMDHRARGQINRLRPPAAGLSVMLKEEKTRIREWEEREATALRKRKEQLWVQLPDRKVSAQSQYPLW